MFKAVVFDIGGVLAYDIWEPLLLDKPNKGDKTEGIASKYHLDENLVKKIGAELWNKFAYTLRDGGSELYIPWTEKEYWEEFVQKTKVKIPLDDFIKITDKFVKPIKDFKSMERILEDLKELNFDLAILSNNTEFWAKRQIEKLQLNRFFEESKMILSCRIGAEKTNPKMFNAFLIALDCIPRECIFIDDRLCNIEAAKKLEIKVIHFQGSQKLVEGLRNLGIDIFKSEVERESIEYLVSSGKLFN